MFKIGHYTDSVNLTGCTVLLFPPDTNGSCYISGSAPGSRELALLDPVKKMQQFNALLLTGGSAFGLNAAAGVMKFLEEQNTGYQTPYGLIPIVPAAVIYDLNIGNGKVRPGEKDAWSACKAAGTDFSKMGSLGAGTGATVGKWAGLERAMKGGLGIAEIRFGETWVKAVSVVNPVGDVIGPKGEIIAGAVDPAGRFLAKNDATVRWKPPEVGFNQNTVLAALLTNAKLTKTECFLMSRRSNNAIARAINPANTSYDGDVIFTFSHGEKDTAADIVYEMAVESLYQSILNGVKNAKSAGGIKGLAGD